MAEVRSEEQLGRKYDKFLANLAVKSGTGFVVGTVFSLFLFRRRAWPIWLSTGAGVGFAGAQFQEDLNRRN